MTSYDALVIGGGAAGLSGAIVLARSRRSVAVIEDGTPRNAPADGVHVLLGHDGIPPLELLQRGRAELARYGGEVVTGEVSAARREGDHFVIDLADGQQFQARRLLVATGVVDELPDVPGLAPLWGSDVVHCPYCHGWEVRDHAIGIIASHPMFTHQALMFAQLSDDVVVFTHGVEPTAEQREQLRARSIELIEDGIEAVEAEGGRLTGVRLKSGRTVARETIAVQSVPIARLGALAALGLELVEHESGMFTHVPTVDPGGRSAVEGVWLAGNVTEPMAQVGAAGAAGTMAGAQINADLIMEQTAAAAAALTAQPAD